jgi:large subunit ribosomal protein L17
MRHRKTGRKLGRNPKHQRALLRSLATALILTEGEVLDERNKPAHPGRIITTLQKAKEVRPFLERCITIACRALPYLEAAEKLELLGNKQAVRILFDTIAPRMVDRPGGYTRILRLAKPRRGDSGPRAILEFVGTHDRKRKKAPKPSFAPLASEPKAPKAPPPTPESPPPAETPTAS